MNRDPKRAKAIFDRALEIQAATERDELVRRECADDVELRARVQGLLGAYEQAGSFLESPPAGLRMAATVDRVTDERPGTVVGPYKLLEQIGEGGFGVVFMAEQTHPVRRKVALKVLKPGMDTRQVVARFEAERQALAIMDHPNIAKVFDGGATDSGRPYFVMELVKGIPITDYCDQHHLTPRQRLELFVNVCQAVQHAHQKGIIHRDLKPSNVLVTIHDTTPVVKVIDFGVAKALGQELTDRTLFTGFAQMIGTPLYMSPEQAGQSGLDVDTRSDIYSLGVLLYELLTSTTPFVRERFQKAAYDEIRRIIREEEPPKPSARLSELGRSGTPSPTRTGAADSPSTLASVSASRHTEPARLTKLFRGEVDWIVMKALEKDRNRRYETANAFAADVQRYLSDEPVLACPPSASYRFRKFAKRNNVAFLTASVVAAALMAGTAVATWQAVRATRAKETAVLEKARADHQAAVATSISNSLKQLIGSLNPDAAKGPDYTARQLLDDFATNLEANLTGLPEAAADLHAILGGAYGCLGERVKAEKHLGRALALRREVFGERHERYADSLVDYARPDAHSGLDAMTKCETNLHDAVAIYRARGVGGEPVIRAYWTLIWCVGEQSSAGNPSKRYEVEPLVMEALAEAAKSPGVEFPKVASILHYLAGVRVRQSRYAEAEQIAREAVAMHLKLDGPDHLETAWGYVALGGSLKSQGKCLAALDAEKTALRIMRKALPIGHRNIALALGYGRITLNKISATPDLSGLPASPAVLDDWRSIAWEILATTKPGTLDWRDPVWQSVNNLAAVSELDFALARKWDEASRAEDAAASRQKGLQVWDRLQSRFSESPDLLALTYAVAVPALTKSGQPQKAKQSARKLAEVRTSRGADLQNQVAWLLVSAVDSSDRDPALAADLASQAVTTNPGDGGSWNTLGVARYRGGDWKAAVAALERSMQVRNGGDSFDWFFLAMAHQRLGEKDKARECYGRAVAWMDKNQPRNEELRRFRKEAAELLGKGP